jgi:large subunit ribosomal protein L7/L12
MGLLRKTILISTGGLAPVKANSKKERTAKAAEKQLKVQKQMLNEQRRANPVPAPARPARASVAPATAPTQAVILVSAGDTKIEVIKVIRNTLGIGLKEAKALADRPPSRLPIAGDRLVALRDALVGAGATVKIEAPAHESHAPGRRADGSGSPASITDDLHRVAELRDQGLLTDDEFTAAKSRILAGD